MERRLSAEELHVLRNEVLIRQVIETLLEIPSKEIEGIYRFL